MNVINKEHLINEEIRVKELRVISQDGEQLGIMPTKQALEMAEMRQLDLVLIAPKSEPPVARIMEYGKFVYEQQKKEKEAKKKQKVITVKEVRITPNIEEHDLNVKAKNAEKFLKDGDKVKVTVKFRGREADYAHFGEDILNRFYDKIKEVGQIEKPAKLEGKNMTMVIAPKKA
ncbi:MAG: translation initiation factor IF-3 [Clostridiales bacterium]|nr:translation initiation factor IF-3 [Clostridiales bacterium]